MVTTRAFSESPLPKPPLKLTCRVENGWLHLDYTFANSGQRRILSYDGAGDESTEWPDYTGKVYVSYARTGTVEIKRVLPPVPAGKRITRVVSPWTYLLKPGEQRRVRFRLALPLRERSEYFPDFKGAIYEQRRVNKVQLSIGYFYIADDLELEPTPKPNVYRNGSSQSVQQVTAASCDASIEVSVRTDPVFERV